MAVTKIKPIRGTVNKAIAYIIDPKKTDDELLVSSFGCAASDAAAKEFEWTRNLGVQRGMQMPKVIARHLIQSFDIGEVSPEQAHVFDVANFLKPTSLLCISLRFNICSTNIQ